MVFKSAIDSWYWAIIILTSLLLLAIALPIVGTGETVALLTVGACAVLALGLPLWLAYSTEYRLSDTVLFIRSGPFRWSIRRDAIQRIRPTRSVLSSPALSLDRLEITYESGQTILVSPADKDSFLKALSVEA